MTEWQYEMTVANLTDGALLGSPESSEQRTENFQEIIDGMRKKLTGSGWEVLSHSLTSTISGEVLTVVWRKSVD